jgi:hypothetical protein
MSAHESYIAALRKQFAEYRNVRFAGQEHLFEDRAEGEAVVWAAAHQDKNVMVPSCQPSLREQIICKIPVAQRHQHFASMQSSQALTQTVFGVIEVLSDLSLLSGVKAEDGRSAFGPALAKTKLVFEKKISTLGENSRRATSVDVWFDGPYRVAVECKLGERDFGSCSRTRLEAHDPHHCNGNYVLQGGREDRCSLTHVGVKYWDFSERAFGWSPNEDHIPCPMREPYQLARNVLAACVTRDGVFDENIGHALVIYDCRNPSVAKDGLGDGQWQQISQAIKIPGVIRRLSWQSLIDQFPHDGIFAWLQAELNAKYGLHPLSAPAH